MSLSKSFVDVPVDEEPALSQQQQHAIIALLTARSYRDAARKVGCNERTIRRWLKDDVFREKLLEARREVNACALSIAQEAALHGVEVLRSIIQDDNAPAYARIQALRLAWEWGRQGYEMHELEDRLQSLYKTNRRENL